MAGKAVTATLEDSDGDVINDKWQWYALTGQQIVQCWLLMLMMLMMRPAHRPLTALDEAHIVALENNDTDIEIARSKTYTPKCLVTSVCTWWRRQPATWTVPKTRTTMAATPGAIADFIRFDNRAQSASVGAGN